MKIGHRHDTSVATRVLRWLAGQPDHEAAYRAISGGVGIPARGGAAAAVKALERCGWVQVHERQGPSRADSVVEVTTPGHLWLAYLERMRTQPALLGRVEMFARMAAAEAALLPLAALGKLARERGLRAGDVVEGEFAAGETLLAAAILFPRPEERVLYPWTAGDMYRKHAVLGAIDGQQKKHRRRGAHHGRGDSVRHDAGAARAADRRHLPAGEPANPRRGAAVDDGGAHERT